ncbi:MarR family winged helix-turn-helix transcriptional regulator [Paractinoplanes maris]|uniref:MarR family winged helix-turn-helix transcriptional regulator n=1 Tax=Paractinoplanes maris TaxID=1734446 RepID=UPI00201FD667|nr:MarR family transcriptional regulator [Actinoplanes maris]
MADESSPGKARLIADIMGAQKRLQDLIAEDRADPLFSSHLTLSQLKILMLLARHGSVSGSELAGMLGIGAATLTGMIDRLVVQDLVARAEDPHDRRVRRIALTRAGRDLIGSIFNAGEARMRTLLSRLSAEELDLIAQATTLIIKAAESSEA